MPHTYTWSLHHIVFATKKRQPLIPTKVLPRLWTYLGGIARNEKITAFAIGGTENHLHLLATLPPTLSLSKALGMLKACSSKWLNEVVFRAKRFDRSSLRDYGPLMAHILSQRSRAGLPSSAPPLRRG